MSQQINLYSPIFRRQRKYFSAQTMAVSIGVVLIGVAALSVYARMQVAALETQAAQTAKQLKARIDQLQAATADKSGEERRKAVEAQVKTAEEQLRTSQQIAAAIESSAGDARGFSGYVRALARQTVNGVWLTSINIDFEGEGLSLAGAALRPELVPDYIDRLRREEIFKGKSFGRLEIGAPVTSAAAAQAAAEKASPAGGAPSQRIAFRLLPAGAAQPAAEQ